MTLTQFNASLRSAKRQSLGLIVGLYACAFASLLLNGLSALDLLIATTMTGSLFFLYTPNRQAFVVTPALIIANALAGSLLPDFRLFFEIISLVTCFLPLKETGPLFLVSLTKQNILDLLETAVGEAYASAKVSDPHALTAYIEIQPRSFYFDFSIAINHVIYENSSLIGLVRSYKPWISIDEKSFQEDGLSNEKTFIYRRTQTPSAHDLMTYFSNQRVTS